MAKTNIGQKTRRDFTPGGYVQSPPVDKRSLAQRNPESSPQRTYRPTESKVIVGSCVVASAKAEPPGCKPTVEAHARGVRSAVRSNCSTCSTGANGLISWNMRRGASKTRFTLNARTSGPPKVIFFPKEISFVAFGIVIAFKVEDWRSLVTSPEFVTPLEVSRVCCCPNPRATATVRTTAISRTTLMIKIEGRLHRLSSGVVTRGVRPSSGVACALRHSVRIH